MEVYTTSDALLSILAGMIQGVTELLPVSSSGHLLLFSELTSLELTLMSVAVLHLGTLGALLIVMKDSLPLYFKKDTLIKVLISILPAGIIGFLFDDIIESALGLPVIIVASLILWGVGLVLADRYAATAKASDLDSISTRQALLVGLFQPLAFIPGTSRSGITTIAGILGGLDRDTALRFSFLSGIPLLGASGGLALVSLITDGTSSAEMSLIGIATAAAFFTGLGAAYFLTKYINRSILTVCGIYRIVLGIILIGILGISVL
jgi:undecaprenyl-diphosphatase